ncbi:MAG TPA: nitronate monooxygenase [Mycobacteriales bacterium]|nr:nitronate monooxygenase [Mycobacteriales bacterium]
MELTTPLCRALGITVPVVQAPIGSATTPELAAAVSGAGALGMLALTWLPPHVAAARVRRTLELTSAPFGVNVCLDFPIDAQLDAALALGVRVVSTFWGDPLAVHDRVHEAGALHLHTVRSPDEARAAVDAGVDAVVAQGWEAGGHVWGEVATLPLTPAVVDAVAPVPVIAAGGIADGRGLAAALVLGAQAAWLGTRFVAAAEASTHEHYRARVVAAGSADAAYTACFDGGWADAPHRVLRNATLDAWEDAGRPVAPDRPGEGDVVATDRGGQPFHRYDDMVPLRGLSGDVEAMALYAGQSVGLVHEVAPAAEIVAAVVAQAQRALAAFT